MILLIDHYDSFTYNLYQAIAALGEEVEVVRSDAVTVEEALARKPSHLVLSPGPKTPNETGISMELVERTIGSIPILGVCLGHQLIAKIFGGDFGPARQIVHGKTSPIFHNESDLFEGLPNPFEATRYHSLAVTHPGFLHVMARTEDQEIMALRHPHYPIFGLQFHPESVLTQEGPKILKNFISLRIAH